MFICTTVFRAKFGELDKKELQENLVLYFVGSSSLLWHFSDIGYLHLSCIHLRVYVCEEELSLAFCFKSFASCSCANISFTDVKIVICW